MGNELRGESCCDAKWTPLDAASPDLEHKSLTEQMPLLDPELDTRVDTEILAWFSQACMSSV